jgi:hypothetical protein
MKVDIVKELLNNHSDEEITAYLDSIVTGLLQNYKTAIKQNQSEILYGNIGDLTLVATIIRAMKNRNEAREAMKNS